MTVRPDARLRAPARTRISLLGHFALDQGSEPTAVSVSGQRVLALLALHARPVRRTSVSALLWPDTSTEKAAQNLRSVLHRMPRADDMLLDSTRETLSLVGEVEVDLRTCTALILDLCDRPEAAGPVAPDLMGMILTDLLPDWFDEWLIIEQERFRQLRMHALEAVSARLCRAGSYAAALHTGLSAVAVEPLRESAHRTVVQVHLAEGNVGEALRQYDICRRLLDEGLGIGPSTEFQALVFPRT